MSFCQKHRNHHCIHAHQCHNQEHAAKRKSAEKLGNVNKTLTNKQKDKKEERCNFHSGKYFNELCKGHQVCHKQLQEKDNKIKELMSALAKLQQGNDGLNNQVKGLYAQIEYYRQQFGSLIDTTTNDGKNQIKKRVKQTTDLSLRVKVLQNQKQSLQIQNDRLRQQMENTRTAKDKNRRINENIEEKYNSAYQRFKLGERDREELKQKLKIQIRQTSVLQKKYTILKGQFGYQSQKYIAINQQLKLEVELTKKQLQKLKRNQIKEKQISQAEKDKNIKKEQLLKAKMEQYQIKNKQYASINAQLNEKCSQLQEDLIHAKRFLQKNHLFSQQVQSLQRQIDSKHIEEMTMIRQSKFINSNNLPNNNKENSAGEVQKLHQQIKLLKQKISELQKRSTTNYEDIFLTLGASEAFKKLIEEKNVVIKKLMREKGQIYNRLTIMAPK